MAIIQRSNLTSRAGLRSAAVWVVWVTVFIALGAAAAAQRAVTNIAPVTTVSAASYDAVAIAPESIVASFGTMLATTTVIASDADPNTPALTVPGAQSVNAGQTLSFPVSATDADQGQTLNCVALNLPPGAALNRETASNWVFTWTPTFTQSGGFLVDFKVTDNDGEAPLSDVKSVAITVGAKWARTSGPEGGRVFNLFSFGENLFAATFSNGLFLSTDGGQTWTTVNSNLPISQAQGIEALVTSGGNLFAGHYGLGVFRSSNQGRSWTPVVEGPGSLYVLTLAVSGTTLYAGTDGGGIFISTNNGQSWAASNRGLTSLAVRTIGANWKQVNAGLLNIYVTSVAVSGKNLLVGTQGGGVFVSQIPD